MKTELTKAFIEEMRIRAKAEMPHYGRGDIEEPPAWLIAKCAHEAINEVLGIEYQFTVLDPTEEEIDLVHEIHQGLTDEEAREVVKYIDRKFDDGINEENVDLAIEWIRCNGQTTNAPAQSNT